MTHTGATEPVSLISIVWIPSNYVQKRSLVQGFLPQWKHLLFPDGSHDGSTPFINQSLSL